MNAKAEQKERTHREILASAARLLRERGIVGANVADVMKGAGLTVGGFYAHFSSKEALVDEVLRRTLGELRTTLLAGLESVSPSQRVETALRRYLSRTHRDDLAGGCPLPAISGEIGTEHGAHGASLAEHLSSLADAMGVPRDVALGILALMVGGLTLARALRGTPLSDDILRASKKIGIAALRELVEVPAEDEAQAARARKR